MYFAHEAINHSIITPYILLRMQQVPVALHKCRAVVKRYKPFGMVNHVDLHGMYQDSICYIKKQRPRPILITSITTI